MEDLAAKITQRLEELRCHLQADGGDLEIVEIKEKTVKNTSGNGSACHLQ